MSDLHLFTHPLRRAVPCAVLTLGVLTGAARDPPVLVLVGQGFPPDALQALTDRLKAPDVHGFTASVDVATTDTCAEDLMANIALNASAQTNCDGLVFLGGCATPALQSLQALGPDPARIPATVIWTEGGAPLGASPFPGGLVLFSLPFAAKQGPGADWVDAQVGIAGWCDQITAQNRNPAQSSLGTCLPRADGVDGCWQAAAAQTMAEVLRHNPAFSGGAPFDTIATAFGPLAVDFTAGVAKVPGAPVVLADPSAADALAQATDLKAFFRRAGRHRRLPDLLRRGRRMSRGLQRQLPDARRPAILQHRRDAHAGLAGLELNPGRPAMIRRPSNCPYCGAELHPRVLLCATCHKWRSVPVNRLIALSGFTGLVTFILSGMIYPHAGAEDWIAQTDGADLQYRNVSGLKQMTVSNNSSVGVVPGTVTLGLPGAKTLQVILDEGIAPGAILHVDVGTLLKAQSITPAAAYFTPANVGGIADVTAPGHAGRRRGARPGAPGQGGCRPGWSRSSGLSSRSRHERPSCGRGVANWQAHAIGRPSNRAARKTAAPCAERTPRRRKARIGRANIQPDTRKCAKQVSILFGARDATLSDRDISAD